MSSEIRFRQLAEEDWEVFREVRLAALLDAPNAFSSSYKREVAADEDNWRKRLGDRAQFVAELDGKVVGTAGGIASDVTSAALISMWVAPRARGQGAAQGLVHQVLDWAKREGFHAVCLWVTDGNAAAETLYARCGFTRTGATQPVHSGECLMELEMIRRLG